jgi:hypothetical protein
MKSLQEKIRKGEYSGGSGSKPPGGRGSGGGGNSDGSEEGMSDETLQVVFATIGFIFVVHSLTLYTLLLPRPINLLISLKSSLFSCQKIRKSLK